jgi:hypothetical protein
MRWVPIATLKDEALPNVMRKVIAHGLSKTALFRVDNCHFYSLACHLVLQVYCSFEKPTGARRCENLCLNFSLSICFSQRPRSDGRRPMTRRRFSPNGKRISIRGTWTLPSDCTRLAQRSRTLSPALTSGTEGLKSYFAAGAKNKTQVKVVGSPTATKVSDSVVVLSGIYEFSGTRADGQSFTAPARYTFVIANVDGQWRIMHQHSSPQPRPPQ